MDEAFQCSACKKKFRSDGFGIDRFGRRRKTCLECKERYAKLPAGVYHCEHGRQRSLCPQCGGSGFANTKREELIAKTVWEAIFALMVVTEPSGMWSSRFLSARAGEEFMCSVRGVLDLRARESAKTLQDMWRVALLRTWSKNIVVRL